MMMRHDYNTGIAAAAIEGDDIQAYLDFLDSATLHITDFGRWHTIVFASLDSARSSRPLGCLPPSDDAATY